MTQFESIKKTLLDLDDRLDKSLFYDLPIAKLRELLSQSQNKPPNGFADGSISEATWMRLRDLLHRADSFKIALDHMVMLVENFNE